MELFSCRWAQRLGPATSGGATPRTSAWGAGCPVSRCPTRARIPAGRLGPSGRRPLGPPLPGRTEGPRPPPASPEPAAQRPPPTRRETLPSGAQGAGLQLFGGFSSRARPQSLRASLPPCCWAPRQRHLRGGPASRPAPTSTEQSTVVQSGPRQSPAAAGGRAPRVCSRALGHITHTWARSYAQEEGLPGAGLPRSRVGAGPVLRAPRVQGRGFSRGGGGVADLCCPRGLPEPTSPPAQVSPGFPGLPASRGICLSGEALAGGEKERK